MTFWPRSRRLGALAVLILGLAPRSEAAPTFSPTFNIPFGTFSLLEAQQLDAALTEKLNGLQSLSATSADRDIWTIRRSSYQEARQAIRRHTGYIGNALVENTGSGEQKTYAVSHYHPVLGWTVFAAVSEKPSGHRYATAHLDWSALAPRLLTTAVYGYCAIGRSAEDIRKQEITAVPPSALQFVAAADAHAALAKVEEISSSSYGRFLDLRHLSFQVSTHLDKGILRALGMNEALMNQKCASCPTFSDAIASGVYEHGSTASRTLRQNPSARQFYTLTFAMPVIEAKNSPAGPKQVEPVFRFDPERWSQDKATYPACAPEQLKAELAALNAIAADIASKTISWRQLPALVRHWEQRLEQLRKQPQPSPNQLQTARRTFADLASGSVFETAEGRCTAISSDVASRVDRLLQTSAVVVRHCPDCADDTKRLLRYRSAVNSKESIDQTWRQATVAGPENQRLVRFESNGAPLDLGNTYVGSGKGPLTNLGHWAGCNVLFRESELPGSAYQGLLNSADARAMAKNNAQELKRAQTVANKARQFMAEKRYAAAAEIVESALAKSPPPSADARALLLSLYDVVGNSISPAVIDGAAAARAYLQPAEFSTELEAQLAAAPESIQGKAVTIRGEVLQNVLNTGDLLQVNRARMLVVPGHDRVKLGRPIGSTITVYGNFDGDFEYAAGRSVPIVKVIWVEAN